MSAKLNLRWLERTSQRKWEVFCEEKYLFIKKTIVEWENGRTDEGNYMKSLESNSNLVCPENFKYFIIARRGVRCWVMTTERQTGDCS